MFKIQDSQAGNFIGSYATLQDAEKEVAYFEKEDIRDGQYLPNFYEIKEVENDNPN